MSFQTPTGEQLSLQAVPDGSDWLGQLTFGSADDTGVRYVAVVGPGPRILGVGDVTVRFQGPAERVEVGRQPRRARAGPGGGGRAPRRVSTVDRGPLPPRRQARCAGEGSRDTA